MRATIYCRVSTEDQEREGTSLQSQLEACKTLAQERGYDVPDRYILMETYSGLSLDRPKLSELRQRVRDREIDAAIAYTLDRLSRDPVHFIILQEELEKAGVELTLVTEDIDSSDMGKLISYIKGYAAKLEAQKIKERTMRGMRERAKAGRLPGGKSVRLFGYTYVPGKGVGEGVRYINEPTAQWVREIYHWLVKEGLSLNAIVYRLRALGIPTPSSHGIWRKATVYNILRNQSYAGKTFVFRQSHAEGKKHYKAQRKDKKTTKILKGIEDWTEIPNATPAIISEDLFAQAQVRLNRNKELATRNSKSDYLLSGYIFCKQCGRRYAGTRSKTTNRYYRCPNGMGKIASTRCHNQSWNANSLESIVWAEIEALLTRPDVVLSRLKTKEEKAAKANSYQAELEGIEARLRHEEKGKDRVWKAFELTGDEAKFHTEIDDIMANIEALKRRKLQFKRQIEVSSQVYTDIDRIKTFCELASRNLANFAFQDKRLVLEMLGINIWLNNDNVTIEGVIPVAKGDIVSSPPSLTC